MVRCGLAQRHDLAVLAFVDLPQLDKLTLNPPMALQPLVGFTLTQSDDYPRIRPRQDTCADRVAVMIDFDADGRTAYSFGVDLSGSVQDGVVTNENQPATDWDTDWT